jgi:glycosyltransferase involved in cell wall biosynthesis
MEISVLQGLQIAFGFFALVQILYYLGVFSRLALYSPTKNSQAVEPVSVIIVAKNEVENLTKHLPKFFTQNHPTYEIVVVNNCSWDATEELLKELSVQHKNLKIVTIEEQERYPKGKKFALTLGIKAAQYETLLLTDADCYPASDSWITEMQQAYTPKTEIVLGYGAYEKKGGLLNYLIRYETFYTAMQYLSFALAKSPYMGVGRNLSYQKGTFFRVKGFAKHNHILSGDDDLFVNEVANKKNTNISIAPEAFTVSIPKKKWGDWFKQKHRHLHTGKHYKFKHKFWLSLLNITHILFYASGIVLAALWQEPEVTGIIFGSRLLVMFVVFFGAMRKLKESNLIWGLLILDIFYFIYYLLTGIRTLFSRQKKWMW